MAKSEKQQKKKVKDLTRNNLEYDEGVAAYHAGKKKDACPYPSMTGSSLERTSWFNGWHDAWCLVKYGY